MCMRKSYVEKERIAILACCSRAVDERLGALNVQAVWQTKNVSTNRYSERAGSRPVPLLDSDMY